MASEHHFRDEWLATLVCSACGVPEDEVEAYRGAEWPFLAQALTEREVLGFEQLADAVRSSYDIDSVEVDAKHIDRTTARLVPEKMCRERALIPIAADEAEVRIAMANPLDAEVHQEIEWLTGRRVVPLYAHPAKIEEAVARILSPDLVVHDLLRKIEVNAAVEFLGTATEEDAEQEREEEADSESEEPREPVVRLVNSILANAAQHGASDVHIGHAEKESEVRVRVDGQLRRVMVLPRYVGAGPVVCRLKIMAGLDIANRMRPQDGRAKIRIDGEEIALRVSTLPSYAGENVVVRLLRQDQAQVPLEDLGFPAAVLERFRSMLERGEGVLIVTGPTGSGKTTTLYSALSQLAGEEVNVVSIEDPIEYRLPSVTQVQVNEKQGLTFAKALRSVLRQDPDIVMVGEIRDEETAQIACQAAMTGHLVLTTLHTNDAPSAVTRLVDMRVEAYNLAGALLGVTAQRLVRRLCPDCRRAVPADEIDPKIRSAQLACSFEPHVFEPVGCERCGYAGYRGRLGLIELLDLTGEIKSRIEEKPDADAFRRAAAEAGALYPLARDALAHFARGDTSLEELRPYLDLEDLEPLEDDVSGAGSPERGESDVADTVAEPGESEMGRSGGESGDSALRVLLAFEPASTRDELVTVLTDAGFATEVFDGGVETLRAIAREAPDVVLVGAELPDLTPEKVAEGVRTALGMADLPVLAVMPDAGAEATDRLYDAGVDEILRWPGGRPEQIAGRIHGVLRRQHGWASTDEARVPPIPADDAERVAALRASGLLDSEPEERFDHITRTARRMFDVPTAFLCLVDRDRQWFKSRQGIDLSETPRENSFCGHAINDDDVMVVPDAALDPRFAENPLVTDDPRIRFYAGCPIKDPAGHKYGTLCLTDSKPRRLDDEDLRALRDLGRMVERELGAEDAESAASTS